MADKKFPVRYANFVCHFGESELLDYLDEIVVPAFTSGGVRTFKDGTYRCVCDMDREWCKCHCGFQWGTTSLRPTAYFVHSWS